MMNFETLKEKYPLVFPVKPEGGIWIPKGWEELIESLCSCIEEHLKSLTLLEMEMEIKKPVFQVDQIKEKFGGLRFYYSGGDEVIRGMVWFAETFSYKIKYEY